MKQSHNTNSQSFLFTIFSEFEKIGTCSYQIMEQQKYDGTIPFPNSWFYSHKRGIVKPCLKINGLESFNQRGRGNGRLCLQALFELAQRYGCDGRMLVEAQFRSAGFYEACGFQGSDSGKNGFKYFDPNPKNIALLYKGKSQEKKFKFIPFSTSNSGKSSNADTELFNRMLKKANQR